MSHVGLVNTAQADPNTWTKTVAYISTSGIKAPTAPEDVGTPWTGSYVWYGKYGGTSVKYRVLAPKTTTYGGTTMLLDCDSILYTAKFDEDGEPNPGAQKRGEWQYSDMRANLNGSAFLTKTNGFTAIEKAAMASSKVSGYELESGGDIDEWFGSYVGLTGEKVFLLDYKDLVNSKYGYTPDTGVMKVYDNDEEWNWHYHETANRAKKKTNGTYSSWWMRSAGNSYYSYVGLVEEDGIVSYSYDGSYGVSPAFNVNLSSIIFSSVVSGTAGKNNAEYKLTLADSNLKVGIQSGKGVTASGSTITVPYAITGNNASTATQVSVLILDKAYTAGNTNGANVRYYSKLDTGATTGLAATGTGTFTLPAGYSLGSWNSSYYVYLLAEDVNGIHETDYASTPVKLPVPGAPVIKTQPQSISVEVGDTATFTVSATGKATLKYQWQYKAPGAKTWTNSKDASAKTATFNFTAKAGHNGYQFRCVVTDGDGKQTPSNAAKLTVKPKITTQPKSASVLVGNKATFTVAATGKATLMYQWQYKSPSATTWTNSKDPSAKTATFSFSTTAGQNGYRFRCVVTDGNSNQTPSSAVTLTVTK